MRAPRAVRDGALVAGRNLAVIRRVPDAVIALTIQPIMVVLLFAVIFGGSLGGPEYRQYLIPGVLVQTVAFNVFFTTVGTANDLRGGVLARFRVLPMARSAFLIGRTASDLLVTVSTLVVMTVTGAVVGWRIEAGPAGAALGFALLLALSFAMSWVGVLIGLTARSVEVAQSAGLMWLFPLVFVSNAFVATDTLPSWLQPVADWNPLSGVVAAVRVLFGNPTHPAAVAPSSWPAEHPFLHALASVALLTAVFAALALRRFRALDRT